MLYTGFEEDKRLVQVVPSARQIAYENMEFFCFIHFTVNTFTGSEWGDGTEPESIFNPTELDARQWAKKLRNHGNGSAVFLKQKTIWFKKRLFSAGRNWKNR